MILGVDPGLAHSGYVEIDGGAAVILRMGLLRCPAAFGLLSERIDFHRHDARSIGGSVSEVAIEMPTFPPGARPAALLFASFGCWVASCERVTIYSTKKWRALLGMGARKTTAERKADVEACMRERWPGAEAEMAARKIPRSCREHVWDALAIATAHASVQK